MIYTIYTKDTGKIKRVVDYPKAHKDKFLSGVDTSVYGILEGEPPSVNGYLVVNEEFVKDPEYELEQAWKELRLTRDALLKYSDFALLEDSPVNKVSWKRYRKELRDLPSNTQDPFNPKWPVKPND